MAEPKQKLVRASVAPGHTVMVGPLPQKAHGPGTIVELPADEAASLMRAGFLQDPDVAPVMIAPGPTFGQEGNMVTSPAQA